MENLGLYDDSQADNADGQNQQEYDDEEGEYGNTSRSDPTATNIEPEARVQ